MLVVLVVRFPFFFGVGFLAVPSIGGSFVVVSVVSSVSADNAVSDAGLLDLSFFLFVFLGGFSSIR